MSDELAPVVTPEEAAVAAALDAMIDGQQTAEPKAEPKPEPAKAAEPAPSDPPKERDYEAEARAMGWKPKEEWTGDPEKHRDAQTFVELADNDPAVLRKKYDAKVKEVEEFTRRQAAATQAQIERVRQEAQASVAAERAKLAQERDRLIAQYAGDPNAIRQINRNYEAAQANIPDPMDRAAAFEVRAQWEQKHAEIASDPVFQNAAGLLMQDILNTTSESEIAGKSHKEAQEYLFEKLNQRLAQSPAYGRFFQQKEQPKPDVPANGAPPADMRSIEAPSRPQAGNAKGFDSLPAPSKQLYAQLASMGEAPSKEQWAKDYYDA